MEKENIAIIKTKYSKYKFYFNVYQARNGKIAIILGDEVIILTKEQAEKLNKVIDLTELEEFDIDLYEKAYKEGVGEKRKFI